MSKPGAYLVCRLIALGILILLGSELILSAQQLAFPGAEGFGRHALGGRGGDVYHVTKLTDWGEGTLRYGLETATGPRTIVFDLSGTIQLTRILTVSKPYITIAGQTAPGNGITLAGQNLSIEADHIIVRYIRVRLGDQSGGDDDAISVRSGSNIIIDHVTASWGVDETFSFQSNAIDSLTVQWCMITESLRDSHHEKGLHGYGGIMGGLRQSVHHNLYAHHSSRSPKITGRRHCEVDFRNNLIYNWGYNNCYDGTKSYINWVNNYYKAGPGTNSNVKNRIFELSDAPVDPENEGWEISNTYVTSLYAEGNYLEGYPDESMDNWNGGIDFMKGASEAENRVVAPHNFPLITEHSAEAAYPLVLESAGASKFRDAIDERIVKEVETGTVTYSGSKTGTPGIIDSQEDVGGLPDLSSVPSSTDTDRDGMPDTWEIQNGLDPNNPEDRNDDRNSDGYTNLEEYLEAAISMEDVGVEERETQHSFFCYPNPSDTGFTIELNMPGDSMIEIFNSRGQLRFKTSTQKTLYSIADHQLEAGIYLLRVRNQTGLQFSEKLVIH
jgi:pectate lyase